MDLFEMTQVELEWRSALSGKSLVAEAGADTESALDALRALGNRFRAASDSRDRTRLLNSKKAIVLVGLAAVASTRYESGTLWPHVAKAMGCELEQPAQKAIANAFHAGLMMYGLSRFDPPLKNVGEILLHAGVPVRSLSKLLRLLQEREARRPDLNGTEFCAWLRLLSQQDAISKGLDIPTWRFLTEAGEIAADFIDRLLSLLDAVSGDGLESGATFDALPRDVGDEIRRLMDSGELTAMARPPGRKRSRLDPRIVYTHQQVKLQLPHLERELDSDIEWQIVTAGQSRIREVSRPWSGDLLEPLYEVVSAPVASILAKVRKLDREWMIRVVESELPLLVFDDQSRELLTSNTQIPKGRAWFAFPDSGEGDPLEALEFEGSLRLLENADPPYGWDGWSFINVDASQLVRVRPRHTAQEKTRWRFVSAVLKPQLTNLAPLPYVHNEAGGNVLMNRPYVVLPAAGFDEDGGEKSIVWQVKILQADGTLFHSSRFTSSGNESNVDPWPTEIPPLCGDFEIQVQGPLGRGAKFSVSLAERVLVVSTSDFRWFNPGGGLAPARVTMELPRDEIVVDLEPSSSSQVVRLGEANSVNGLNVVVELDHQWLMVSMERQSSSKASLGPASVDVEELHITELRMNLPAHTRAEFHLMQSGKSHQSWASKANQTGILKQSLALISDTASRLGVCELWLYSGVERILVASIRPKQLIRYATVIDDQLCVEKTFLDADLEVGIYLELAPWKKPSVVRLRAGIESSVLPEGVWGSGTARLLARVADPWANPEWPAMPSSFVDPNVLHLECPVFLGNSLEQEFISWAADAHNPLPVTHQSLAHALEIYRDLDSVVSVRTSDELYSDIAQLTRDLKGESLSVFVEGPWELKHHFRLVAEGWAATAPCEHRAVERSAWELSPFLGLLSSAGNWHLGDTKLRAMIEEYLGPSALKILDEGLDPYSRVGRMGQTVIAMSTWSAERVEAIWTSASPVPGPLLDKDQRLIHARALFEARNAISLVMSESNTLKLLKSCHLVMESLVGRDLLEKTVFERTSPVAKWPSLPCVTLSLAFLARLAARGHELAQRVFERRRETLVELAVAAPEMVRQDLILAELWLLHTERQGPA